MMRVFLIALLLYSCGAQLASAATDGFGVSQFINADFTAPTTPGNLTATTTEHDRINLSWDASTDNYLLSGYQVFRDAVQIATTSLTTYTDIGLTASTSYTYHVIAYDFVLNYSSSSNFATATTTNEPLAPPPPPPPPETLPSPTLTEVQLRGISITPEINGALISWATNRATRYELRWGRTQSYELGFVSGHNFLQEHVTFIDGLDANTVYEYELVSFDRGGNARILSSGRFRTLTQPDTIAPANVANFNAIATGIDVTLTWRNPTEDFAYVRIVRNPLYYPRDPNDGYVIYQGTAESLRDDRAFGNLDEVFYTAFVYDANNNRSSGAITSAELYRLDYTPQEQNSDTGTSGELSKSNETFSFSIDDIVIIQDGQNITSVSGTFLVDTTRPFTIHAPYEIFPEHLKSIQVSFHHPVDETLKQSFLLRINNDKTGYEATISQLSYSGTIPLTLTVYDFFVKEMSHAEGQIISRVTDPDIVTIINVATGWYGYVWGFLVLFLILLILLFLVRRRTEDKRPVRLR